VEMPNKEDGFMKVWRKLAIYDTDLPKTALSEIPKQVTRRLTLSWTDMP
jgi:uncharacterized protein YbcC (UPF0753/DUF2309 family)